MTVAQDVLDTVSAMKVERARFEPVWAQVAERMDPYGAAMEGRMGDMSRIFGARPLLLPDMFAAVFTSLLMPRGTFWHALSPLDEGLRENGQVKAWAAKMTRLLFRYRYAPLSGFAGLPRRMGRSLALYGAQCLLVKEEMAGEEGGKPLPPILYEFVPINQVCLARNHRGQYDRAAREHEMTARQMAQAYGEAALPPAVRDALNRSGEQERCFTVVHLVQPASGAKAGHAFESLHVERDSRTMLKRSGFHEFPFIASVMNEVPDSAYGWGPAMSALPDVKQYYAMARTTTRAMEKAVDPPMGIRGKLERRINLNAGAFNPDLIDEQGRPKFAPLQSGAQPVLGLEGMERKSAEIGASFSENLWQVLANKPGMTAYEAAIRAQEKGDLIGPPFAPQEEMLGLLVERELAILERKARYGEIRLPERPPVLEGQPVTLEFTSPMARLRKAGETTGLYRALEFVQAAGQMDAKVPRMIDWDKAARMVADNEGVPADLIVPAEELSRQMRDEEAERQQQAQMMLMQQMAAQQPGAVPETGPALEMP
ncbi:portal protein [Aestuariispira insulae]|uniref:Head-to-tail connecting protein n=1 Tax=Aestuariispira insulae TaxID=1461337 RepID=A0A3D9HRN6_9PROT|nr:portal protein [Aestuariispira insulae]RED52173.1 head-to-tail connecting protein [Aestuariispira insulae]